MKQLIVILALVFCGNGFTEIKYNFGKFSYEVTDTKGYHTTVEENKKGSFSNQPEDTGIHNVFVIEVTLEITTDTKPDVITETNITPEKMVIQEESSKRITIFQEEEKITVKETTLKEDGSLSPNLKVKVKEKLYNPFQGVLKKKDGTFLNLNYSDTDDVIPIIPNGIDIYECDKIVIYYITEERLPFIYEFGHTFYSDILKETCSVFKPLKPVMVKE